MRGVNRYESQIRMVNASALNESVRSTLRTKTAAMLSPTSPCIFLSHKSEDKDAVKKIAEYIRDRGVDIYLDADDPFLQKAVLAKDDKKITEFIELGIKSSTDLMSILSEKTKGSWWVPYEVGFGRSSELPVATMKLRDVTDLPSFLLVTHIIEGTGSLDKYIDDVKRRQTTKTAHFDGLVDALLEAENKNKFGLGRHPLATYLKEGM